MTRERSYTGSQARPRTGLAVVLTGEDVFEAGYSTSEDGTGFGLKG